MMSEQTSFAQGPGPGSVGSRKRSFQEQSTITAARKKTKKEKPPKPPVFGDEDVFELDSGPSRRPQSESNLGDANQAINRPETKESRKQKRKDKKAAMFGEENLDEERRLNLAIGQMDRHMLGDYVAKYTKRFEPQLSTVELEDLYISGRF
jgi:hypothetical protein